MSTMGFRDGQWTGDPMYKYVIPAFIGLLTLCWLPSDASGRAMESSEAKVTRQATSAVVNIALWKMRAPGEQGQSGRRVKVYASGFLVDPSGIIVTNKHVVDGALDLKVIFADGSGAPAKVLAAAAMLDLALIKVKVGHALPYLDWANSDTLEVGDPVLTIGNPLGLGTSVSAGIVSALNRDLQDTPFDSYIQTDAAINHGNSGGPLIDQSGKVVGVNTALYNPDEKGGFIGIGFAMPSNTIQFVVHHLLDPSHPKPGWLGVTLQDMTHDLTEALGLPSSAGAIISAIDPSGPASRAFLRPGDVLDQVNGVKSQDSRAFMRTIVMIPVGATADLTIWRDGRQQHVTTTVAEWPQSMPSGGVMDAKVTAAMNAKEPDLGVRFSPITTAARQQFGLDPNLTGALVSSVEDNCEAYDLGIVPGDVITVAQGEPVHSPEDVKRAVTAAHQQERRYLALLVQSKGGPHWVSMSIAGGAF